MGEKFSVRESVQKEKATLTASFPLPTAAVLLLSFFLGENERDFFKRFFFAQLGKKTAIKSFPRPIFAQHPVGWGRGQGVGSFAASDDHK